MAVMQSPFQLAVALSCAAVLSTTMACADDATDWYIELKKIAKYARISAQGGARGDDLRPFTDAASALARRALDLRTRMPSVRAESTCMAALRDLEAALKHRASSQVHAAIVTGEERRDRCLAEIQRR